MPHCWESWIFHHPFHAICSREFILGPGEAELVMGHDVVNGKYFVEGHQVVRTAPCHKE